MTNKFLPIFALLTVAGCSSGGSDAKKAMEPQPPSATAGTMEPSEGPRVVEMSRTKELEKGVGRVEVQFSEISATVKAVNVEKRTITVVGAEKKLETFDVDPAVKRLAEVKP